MNVAGRAILFNILLFPGCGQIYLKHYKKGILILAGTVVVILSILWSIIQKTIAILKISPFQKGTVTIGAIVDLAMKSLSSLDSIYLLSIFCSLMALWLFSIIDAYLVGKKVMASVATPKESI